MRIDEGGEFIRNHTVFDSDRTDFDDLIFHGRKSRRLDIKDHERIRQFLSFVIYDSLR